MLIDGAYAPPKQPIAFVAPEEQEGEGVARTGQDINDADPDTLNMQNSLKNPEKLDLVTFDAAGAEYVLIISAMSDWDDSEEEQAFLLQKINNYLRFVIDGGLAEHYPQSKGRPIRVQIDSASKLPPNVGRIITQAQALLSQHGIRLCVNLICQ